MEHDRRRALFADGTKNYRNPMEPNIGDRLTLRFRTARRSAKKVMLCICGQTKRRMLLDSTNERFDYYTIDFRVEGSFSYYFEIEFDDEEHSVCYYDRGGVWNIARSEYYFRITPGFSTPNWAKGAVMYQIYVDRFCNGDATNDVLDDEYFYVVEAVPDSARKTLYVTTAYINKNDTIAEAGDALSLNPDVQNGLQSDVSSNIIIPRDK